jgi:hypothetical protein
MSEYQYYEFQAIDRPLTKREQRKLRGYSTRATITSTRFVNEYHWGDFKGDPAEWMEKHFDAFLYLANWGSRQLTLRIPEKFLSLKTAKSYCDGNAASARAKGKFIILDFHSHDEDGGWEEDGAGWLTSLKTLRSMIINGDRRALYLARLLNVQAGEVGKGAHEPPCPSGLRRLSAPLKAFAEFMRIDSDKIAAAAGCE